MPVLADRVRQEEGGPAPEELLRRAHSVDYLQRLRQAAEQARNAGGVVEWEGELRVSAGSWEAAVGTAGAAAEAARAVGRGALRNAFVVGRPPGHGAGPDGPGGRSLINHVAVAARALQEEEPEVRLLIVDWDVHGAAGTEAILQGDPHVTLLTVDEEGDTPGSGEEPTRQGGAGSTVVREWVPEGTPREEYLRRFENGLRKAVGVAPPDFVLISAGLDVLEADPVGGQALAPRDVYALTARVVEEARAGVPDRVVAVLEGGYEPASTGEGVAQMLRALSGLPPGGA